VTLRYDTAHLSVPVQFSVDIVLYRRI